MSTLIDLRAGATRILQLQRKDGAIPWVEAGIWDPWNHGECAMALAVAGQQEAAFRALDCLMDRQEADGGWTGELGAGVPMDETNRRLAPRKLAIARDTNFTGYAAVAVLRSVMALNAPRRLTRYAPMVARAMDFVLSCQTPYGDVVWRAPEPGETLDDIDALRAGNACLYKSLECAIQIAAMTGGDCAPLRAARARIAEALRDRDWRFDRMGEDRRRYAMDWYYPVLAGVHGGAEARRRLSANWRRFVEPGLGCRCVADEPWVTAAETAELALACAAAGAPEKGAELIRGLAPLSAAEGGYWMGWQFAEEIVWPYERPGWTAAAVILAADAIEGLAPGHDLLVRNRIKDGPVTRSGEEAPAS